jgi:hypothetical protein
MLVKEAPNLCEVGRKGDMTSVLSTETHISVTAYELGRYGWISRARYERISRAHGALGDAIRRAGEGPRNAATAESARLWRKHGNGHWTVADLRAESEAVRAAMEGHPDYSEWIRLSQEQDRRIARNLELGRLPLAYTDDDWGSS